MMASILRMVELEEEGKGKSCDKVVVMERGERMTGCNHKPPAW